MTSKTPDTSKPTGSRPRRKGSVAPKSFRGRLGAGVLIIIPLAVTAILIRYVFNAALAVGVHLFNWFSRSMLWAFDITVVSPTGLAESQRAWHTDLIAALAEAAKNPPKIDPSSASWPQNILAVVLTGIMLYLLGWLGTNVVGRRFLDFLEGLVERIPLVATIYSAIKRMVQSLSGGGETGENAQQVVLIDFPHENMNAIAFMTNVVTDKATGRRLATVYVPTTPNPTSGYMLIVPLERITETDWSMEEALSMVLSGGATARSEVMLSRPAHHVAGEHRSPAGQHKAPAPGHGRKSDRPG